MQKALADFRIESETVVFLMFTDGCSYRVGPKDLERFLVREDLRRVRRALRLRNQFIRRILPPTALAVLLVGIIGLGRYDIYQVARNWAPSSVAHSKSQLPAITPTASHGSSPKTGSALSIRPAAAVSAPTSSGKTTVTAALTHSASRSAGVTSAAAKSSVTATPARPVPVLVPVTQVAPAVPQILTPLTTPLAHSLQLIPKLLP